MEDAIKLINERELSFYHSDLLQAVV